MFMNLERALNCNWRGGWKTGLAQGFMGEGLFPMTFTFLVWASQEWGENDRASKPLKGAGDDGG